MSVEEQLPLAEQIGDPILLSHVKFMAAQIRAARGIENEVDLEVALSDFSEAYGIVRSQRHAAGVIQVGLAYGQFLAACAAWDEARNVLEEVRAACEAMGQEQGVAYVDSLMAQIEENASD